MRIGNKIRKVRELKGFSQEYMALELGMSPTGYGNIERNESDINIQKLMRVSEVLGVKAEDILTLDETGATTFNNYDHTQVEQQIGNYTFPLEMKQLYEDKIALLEDKISYQKEQITTLQDELKKLRG